MEHWEAIRPGGCRFVWDEDCFRPGTDTFALASVPRLRPGMRVCDLGCGTGLLALLLLEREPDLAVTGVELQPYAAALCRRAAAENGLEGRLTVLEGDIRRIRELLPAGRFDLVVSNPPYYPVGSGRLPAGDALRRARSEDGCTLAQVCAAAAYLLRWGGKFCLVHKPERLTDVFCALREAGLEPKGLRSVCPRPERPPSLVLIEAARGGRPGLDFRAPLILQTDSGAPTAEADAIYFRQQEDMP